MLRDRSDRAFAVGTVSAVLALSGACVSGSAEPRPVPSLASSPAAGTAFEAIREAWRSPDRVDADAQRELVERFLARFPSDGLALLARVYLALIAMKQGDFSTADQQLALGAKLPAGTARDVWTIASARRARLGGDAEAALELLRPLIGKTVDPLARAVFEEELTLAALATHREYEAISYMDAWLRASTDEDKKQTAKTVTLIVEQLPKEVLLGALKAMRTQRASFGYGIDIERILAERLVRIATTSGDAELARMLLDPDAGAVVVTGNAGEQLEELATSRRGLNLVDGRTIGLLLPTDSPGLRDESADVLRGVMWALGLPRGVRSARAAANRVPNGGSGGAPTLCAPLEPAPALVEPSADESVRLATRNDAGSVDRTEGSLEELAGEGAAIVIAGLDEQTAERALRWGNAHSVPVVSLVSPRTVEIQRPFAFLLGEPRDKVVAALSRAAPSLAAGALAPVIDAGEVAQFPPQGGRLGSLTLLPPISCDIPETSAGNPRFPIAQWEREKAHAWLVSGSPGCARDLIDELSTARARGVVALALEAAATPAHAAGLRVVSASAGVVPESAASEARDDELRRFSATLGMASWWTALGRDAATLARAAVRNLATTQATDPHSVVDRRTQARDALAVAHARLWSTEASGWTDEHTMKRTVCTIDAPSR